MALRTPDTTTQAPGSREPNGQAPNRQAPRPRGPLSGAVLDLLSAEPPGTPPDGPGWEAAVRRGDPWSEDHQLALHLCYEMHDRGLPGVHAGWEWDPGLLALRSALERPFLAAVRAETGPVPPLDEAVDRLLTASGDGGPSAYLQSEGERWQAREYLVHRSVYHLKEADPQLWLLPRIHGPAQAVLMTVVFDEYGAGRPENAHALLFARMMADLGLEPGYGHYLDAVPAPALAVVNLMTLFGLHRVLRGAAVGQFAAIEITSPPGAARLAAALERLGAGPDGTLFYREHVEADAVHEQLVRRGVIDALTAAEPGLAEDIAFGLAAAGTVDDRFAAHLLDRWRAGRSSLRSPLPDGPGGSR
ncbi:iron-containing redox enzyme family protein [Kitasatospora putterlickiae]|uniref:Iron-containing redox enzyme family protein n=1 Tax=Kitasatospora putterlickiae TaxID=221725 RepID=A0ABN1YGU2_9ACTN